MWDLDGARAGDLSDGLGGDAVGVAVDITVRSSVVSAVASTGSTLGAIDVLVNAAGIDVIEPFLSSEETTWERIVAVNFLGTVRCCHVVVPGMVERGWGASSTSRPTPVGSDRRVRWSTAAPKVVSSPSPKVSAREVATAGVTINVICPGPTDTPLLDQVAQADRKLYDGLARAVPMKRIARPEDIAPAVVFFASAGAEYVTGQTLSISGGLTMV